MPSVETKYKIFGKTSICQISWLRVSSYILFWNRNRMSLKLKSFLRNRYIDWELVAFKERKLFFFDLFFLFLCLYLSLFFRSQLSVQSLQYIWYQYHILYYIITYCISCIELHFIWLMSSSSSSEATLLHLMSCSLVWLIVQSLCG